MAQTEQEWGSRLGLILAMAGSAVGLGNFLRFPIQAVQNGGGAFIIPYLVSFFLLGIPLAMIEWSTGKFAGQFERHSPPTIMQALNKSHFWRYSGALCLFSSIVICAYYCYIESWILSYTIHSVIGTFNGLTEYEVSQFFDVYMDLGTSTFGFPFDTMIIFILCLFVNIFILSHGIAKGIERAAKFCMPLLLIFGLFLVYKAYTMKAGVAGAKFDSVVALDFLWTPDFDSLSNPKVWLSAAGQIFFTLSLGMGAIQTYASYMKKNDDIALNSMTSAFTNEFAEIVLGSALIIPISIGYFGVDKVIELTKTGGFGLGFRTMPYLFEQWGDLFSAVAGLSFFGILFIASITSSISISQPFIAFLSRNYNWSQKKSSYTYGIIILLLALPCVLFFEKGVFDQYDFWGGTVSLFLFAMLEAIAFSWVLGIEKGWKLINDNADLKMPGFYKYVLRYVTPTMLILIFVCSLIKPKDDDWSLLSFKGWELDDSSIIGELRHQNVGPNKSWFATEFYAENDGVVNEITEKSIVIDSRTYSLPRNAKVLVSEDEIVSLGTVLYEAKIINNVFYVDMSRIGLLLFLLVLCVFIRLARQHNFEEIKLEE
ncbi:MAG: sodium-dependent transporter [Bacteroidales bacterium]|nr:sodium-dependent transporter [Bacteroidales bacterium]